MNEFERMAEWRENMHRATEYQPQHGDPAYSETARAEGNRASEAAERKREHEAERPEFRSTVWRWRDPSTIPPRPWLYGRHMLRKQVSLTVAPGGVGKSSHGGVEALAMVTGRRLLGEWTASNLRVWLFNLEDDADELDRRITAAMMHYRIQPEAIGDRLRVDTGRRMPLCTATRGPKGSTIVRPVMDALEAELRASEIDVLIVDPFVSSHQVEENDNGAIDMVAKEWAALADRCNCAVELVHHTAKAYGVALTSESGRGASALLNAARSGRVFNRMTKEEREAAGLTSDTSTIFSITNDKANMAPASARVWRRMVSVELGNGDSVGVAEVWEWPDDFDGLDAGDLLRVQQAIEGEGARYSDQTDDWAGNIVAATVGLDPVKDQKRIKRIIDTWLKSGALVKGEIIDAKRNKRPTIEVGEWATA